MKKEIDEVRVAAIKRREIPLEDLEYLMLGKPNRNIKAAIAANPTIFSKPSNIVQQLLTDKNANVRESLAGNSHITLDELKVLANDGHESVRKAVVENSITDETLLYNIMSDEEYNEVNIAIANNPNVTQEIRQHLLIY